MSFTLATDSPSPSSTQEDKPFYGWRYVTRVGADGKATMETQLLTLEDVLHPQEDDVIPENSVHAADRIYLSDVFHARQTRLDHGLVLCDCMVDWGIKGLRDHSPDISVFAGLKVVPPEPIGTFHLAPSGGRCLAAIELVSPHTRKNDVVHKLREYRRAKVPLYVIVDQKKEGGPREVKAYRWTKAKYMPVALDAKGSVLIAPLSLRVGLKDNRIVCYEETGEELGNYTQVEQQAREEAQARQAAELARQVAEQARQTAEQARQAAEQAQQAAEQARQAAERQVHEQAEARQAADRARQSADQAREAAEKRAQELEAELRRLRQEPKS